MVHNSTVQHKYIAHFWLQYSTSTQHSASGVQYEYTLQYSTCVQCSAVCHVPMVCPHGRHGYVSHTIHRYPYMCHLLYASRTINTYICIYIYISICISAPSHVADRCSSALLLCPCPWTCTLNITTGSLLGEGSSCLSEVHPATLIHSRESISP